MDQIIDIFGERKNCESFLFKSLETQVRSAHVILLQCVKQIGSTTLIVP